MVHTLKNPIDRTAAISDIIAVAADLSYLETETRQASSEFRMDKFSEKLSEIRGSASRWRDAIHFQLENINENPYNENKVRDASAAMNEMSSDMIDLANSLSGPIGRFKDELKEIAVRLAKICSLK